MTGEKWPHDQGEIYNIYIYIPMERYKGFLHNQKHLLLLAPVSHIQKHVLDSPNWSPATQRDQTQTKTERVVLGPWRLPPPTNATPIALHVLPTSSHDRWKPWRMKICGLPPLVKNNACQEEFEDNKHTISRNCRFIQYVFLQIFEIGSTSWVRENLGCVLQITLRCFFSLEVCVVGIYQLVVENWIISARSG